MKRSLLGVAAIAALVVACSSSSSSGGGTVDSTCPSFASALCAKTNACNAAGMTFGFGSVDACKARIETVCKSAATAPSTGITPDKIQSCADAQPNLTCGEFYKTGISTVCPAIAGSLANGAPCVDDAQCQSTFCTKAVNTLCGTCAAAPAAGAACANFRCASGLRCNTAGVCATASTSGQKCTGNADCEDDLRCNQGTCGTPAKTGEACSLAGDTAPQCDGITALWCNPIAKKCEAIKSVAAGATCGLDTTTGALTLCEASSYCKTVDAKTFKGTCTARSADGAACTLDVLPAGGSSCLPSAVCENSVCRVPDAGSCAK